MRKPYVFLVAAIMTAPLAAQVAPIPDADDPTRQSVRHVPGEEVLLTAFPGVPLTVIFDPTDPVLGVDRKDLRGWTVELTPSRDGMVLYPEDDAQPGLLSIRTRMRRYMFDLRAEDNLSAAVLVRFINAEASSEEPSTRWSYRLRGDREVRPASVSDDGTKTRILYTPGQPLPAVFAVGPTGEEQVVNGYMRGEAFVIDRVWQELVFRIDGEKATARRNSEPDGSS